MKILLMIAAFIIGSVCSIACGQSEITAEVVRTEWRQNEPDVGLQLVVVRISHQVMGIGGFDNLVPVSLKIDYYNMPASEMFQPILLGTLPRPATIQEPLQDQQIFTDPTQEYIEVRHTYRATHDQMGFIIISHAGQGWASGQPITYAGWPSGN